MTEFLVITYGSQLYEKTVALRDRVLRLPLGMQLTEADRQAESADMHFALLEEESLIATVVASPADSKRARIRQMAVVPERQYQGYGQKLLLLTERYLRKAGVTDLYLHARNTAVGFYLAQGYVAQGEPFLEVGLAHQCMVKSL